MTQGKSYSEFIDSQLKREFDRKSILEGRGQNIASVSSTLIVISFAVVTAINGRDFKFDSTSQFYIGSSAAILLMVIFLGYLASWLNLYPATTVATMRNMISHRWTDDNTDAMNRTALLNLETLESLRGSNRKKSALISFAMGMQLLAMVAIALGVYQAIAF